MAYTLPFAAAFAGAAVLVTLTAAPALALTGREAVTDCVQRGATDCAWTTNRDGGIRINLSDGLALECASADGACAMRYQARRPVVVAGVQAPRHTLQTRR